MPSAGLVAFRARVALAGAAAAFFATTLRPVAFLVSAGSSAITSGLAFLVVIFLGLAAAGRRAGSGAGAASIGSGSGSGSGSGAGAGGGGGAV
ncbi:hypothetical protein, partial [Micromonospora endophytica]|uniref:hypothetical protein n=1 Tax=Micromonospora endophytica TaxID=515350 RepID=UPI0015E8A202